MNPATISRSAFRTLRPRRPRNVSPARPAVPAFRPWRIDEPCPYPVSERDHLRANCPPGQSVDCVVIGWTATSTAHAYPSILHRGTWDECETRRIASNYPQSLRTVQREALPSAAY